MSLPRHFWYIWTALLLNRVGGFVIIILTLYLTTQRGLPEAQAGVVVGLFGAGGAAGVLLGGVTADRWGRKITMVTASLLSAAALAVLAEARNIYTIAVLVAVFGFANAMLGPAAIAAIADVVRPQDRDRAFNLMFWAMNVGMGTATLLAGFLAQYSYLLLFRLDAATALLTGILILVMVPESLPHKVSNGAPAARRPGRFIDVWRDRVYLAFAGLVFLHGFIFAQTQTTLPLAMTADGLTTGQYGLVLAVGSAVIVVGQLLVPRLIARFSKAAVLATALAFMGAGFAMVGSAGSMSAYLMCVLVWTVGNMLAAPPHATVIAELSPPAMRGRYQGVFSLTHTAAAFVAPAIGGFTLQYLGDWHWAVIGAVAVAAAAGHLLTGPRREQAARQRAAAVVQPVEALR